VELNDKYLLAYKSFCSTDTTSSVQKKISALSYSSNLDLLCDFHSDVLNKLLNKFLPRLSYVDIVRADRIDTLDDLLKTLAFFCINGIGGEVDIGNIDLEILRGLFHWKYGIGGTAAQAAKALAAVNFSSMVHLTDNSKEVCDLLFSPYIYVVNEKGRLVHTNELDSYGNPEIHYIFQFKKGETIKIGSEKILIPNSNRLILTRTTINNFLPFNKPFFEYIEQNANKIGSNLISGFNTIVDEKLLIDRLDFVVKHIKKYKNRNPSGIVIFEDAHYHNFQIKKMCLETILPNIDIFSLNDEEIKYILESFRFFSDTEDIIYIIQGAKFIKDRFNIQKGIIVHSKDYSMYIGDLFDINIERGLIYGNLLATSKAMFGEYGNKEKILEVLKLPTSNKGTIAESKVSKSNYCKEVVIVPTKYIEMPKYTIGLGDSFIAGFQITFLM